MTAYVPPYSATLYTQPALGGAAAAVIKSLAACPEIEYDYMLWQVDATGTLLTDLTQYLVKESGAQVRRDCALEVPGVCQFTLSVPLVWGKDRVQPAMLIRSPEYASGQWQRFPLGVYVATTPDQPLADAASFAVVGYELGYLLQNDINDAYQAVAGATYSSVVESLLVGAGLLASGHHLIDIGVYPGDWYAKTVPVGGELTFLPGDTTYGTYIKAINKLLLASGARPFYNNQNGLWVVEDVPTPATQANGWVFARTDTYYGTASNTNIVTMQNNTVTRDVYNVPNQFVFIQQGLTFQPVEGSGQYTVNNLINGPSCQNVIGRVLRRVILLNASGQTDLQTQGDAYVTALYASAETVALETTPWPAAWHYDVFQYTDAALPDTLVRKVQAQSWTLPLEGDPMTWNTQVVAAE